MATVSFSKTIGIIGGAGPMASADLYQRIIAFCQRQYGSEDYHEFPQIILLSYPFLRSNPQKIRKNIASCLLKLQEAGAGTIALACNSFHGYLPETLPKAFINLIDAAVDRLDVVGASRVLVLAAPKTMQLGLYERDGLTCLYPDNDGQKQVNRLIREVAGGSIRAAQAGVLSELIATAGPLDAVLLACTELPLIHRQFGLPQKVPVIDTVDLLAQKLVHGAIGVAKSP